MNGEWRAMAYQDGRLFAQDRVQVLVRLRETDGTYRMINPVELAPGEPLPEGVVVTAEQPAPTFDMPVELAETLLSALARVLLPGIAGDARDASLVMTIRRLERERDKAVSQLDALIAGMGRLGRDRS